MFRDLLSLKRHPSTGFRAGSERSAVGTKSKDLERCEEAKASVAIQSIKGLEFISSPFSLWALRAMRAAGPPHSGTMRTKATSCQVLSALALYKNASDLANMQAHSPRLSARFYFVQPRAFLAMTRANTALIKKLQGMKIASSVEKFPYNSFSTTITAVGK